MFLRTCLGMFYACYHLETMFLQTGPACGSFARSTRETKYEILQISSAYRESNTSYYLRQLNWIHCHVISHATSHVAGTTNPINDTSHGQKLDLYNRLSAWQRTYTFIYSFNDIQIPSIPENIMHTTRFSREQMFTIPYVTKTTTRVDLISLSKRMMLLFRGMLSVLLTTRDYAHLFLISEPLCCC